MTCNFTDVDKCLCSYKFVFLIYVELCLELYFEIILRLAALENRGSSLTSWLSVGVRKRDVGIVYIIMRQLREPTTGGRREREKRKTRPENRCRVADEGNSHLDSRAIKVRLRKPKKRFARKEWNLIRNLYSLVLPGSHEEVKQRERSAGYVERDREKNRCRVEIIQPNNSRERGRKKKRNVICGRYMK